jgi:hypothetical protein
MGRAPVLAVVLALVAVAPAGAANCARTSTGMVALPDLGKGTYRGEQGGLYPGGANSPPASYARQGVRLARLVVPRDRAGAPSPSGRIVLLSIGMSNATREYSAFMTRANAASYKNPALTLVDAAEGGADAVHAADPADRYWTLVDGDVRNAGVTAAQVQAIWLKEAVAGPRDAFPADARALQGYLARIVSILRTRFVKLRLIYLSSRTYAGYATTQLNPEPFAYESGFAVKWTIADRIAGTTAGPWLGWGPYLWTDGARGRRDGFTWSCADSRADDGTHPSDSGRAKVASLLLRFFKRDATTRPWFRRQT